jgi:hypothetical protein
MEMFNYGCLVTAAFVQTRHNIVTFEYGMKVTEIQAQTSLSRS